MYAISAPPPFHNTMGQRRKIVVSSILSSPLLAFLINYEKFTLTSLGSSFATGGALTRASTSARPYISGGRSQTDSLVDGL